MPKNKYIAQIINHKPNRDHNSYNIECEELEVMDGGTLTKFIQSSVYDTKLDQYIDKGTIIPTSDILYISFVEYIEPAAPEEEEEEEEEEQLDEDEIKMSLEED